MNKRQRKKKGLLDQTIKIGSRVLVVENTSGGHPTGTIGDVVDIDSKDVYGVLALYKYPDGDEKVMALLHKTGDLKKLQSRGRRYFL